MYFHKESKTAFVLVPRTGSTSLGGYLIDIGFRRILLPNINPGEQYHLTLNQCKEKYPNLNNYTVYGVFRDPIKRFVSGLMYLWQTSVECANVGVKTDDVTQFLHKANSYDELIDKIFKWDLNAKLTGIPNLILTPQCNWFTDGVKIINYETMVNDISHITRELNSDNIEIRRLNNTYLSNKFNPLSEKVIEFAKTMYKQDYDLLNRVEKIYVAN